MLKSLPIRLLWHSLNWLTRLAIVASAVMAVLTALAILMLRYWLLPNVEQYHDRITASLAGAIGNPVTIGKIEGDWQGFQPRLSFTEVHILNEQRQPALVLHRIDGSVSWMSLFAAELRLASLEIDRPELLIHRDAQGKVFIGGVALSKQGGGNDLADWLLRQSRMVARDALIVWVDEQRDTPPLVLQRVNLRIENLFNHHRFALRAVPPAELATPLDVRGDFYGASFDDLSAWRGQMFTQLDYTNVMAWRPWLDLPGEFSQGRGALRGWLDVEAGKVAGITADLGLRDVVTKLAEDVPEMRLLDLRGRAAWKEVAGGMEVSTRHLALRLQNGVELQPTDFYFRTAKAAKGQPAVSELRANLLQLESLTSLANFLPLEAGLRAKLDTYAPRGRVSGLNAQWQGTLEKPDSHETLNYKIPSYKIKGKFENLALRQVGALPGFSGLSVDVDGSDAGGRLHINSRQLTVDAPGAMREPLFFATLTSQAGWQHKRGELLINVDNAAVANDDLAGNLYGSYQTKAGTLGVLDLTVSLTRGDVRRAARYTPLVALDKVGNDWLNGAMLAGHTEDFRVRIKGNLSDFPLDGTEDALLEIGGHARGVAMEFDKNWPHIENISGEFWIRGNKLEVKSPSATILDAHLQNVTVTIADLLSDDLPLEIKGNAVGPSNTFLQYIQQSPVRGYIDGFTDGMSAKGNGHLDLFVHVPLSGDKPVKVSGALRVQDNDIDLGEGVPLLRNTRGELAFTESGMQASGVSAEILGGAASINVQTAAGGVVHATVQGRSNLDALRKINPHPLLNYLYGGAAWEADIAVQKKSAQLTINSNLQGLGSNLPQPFAKRSNEAMPLRLEKKNVAEDRDVISAQLGKLLSARLVRRDENGAMVIRRGAINFGSQGNFGGENIPGNQGRRSGTRRLQEQLLGAEAVGGTPRSRSGPLRQSSGQASAELRTGIWLSGSLPELSLQGWGDLFDAAGSMDGGVPIAGANLAIGRVSGFGMHIDDLNIDAGKRGDGLFAQLSSSALNGELEWQPRGEGKLTVRLQNLLWSGDDRAATAPVQPARPARPVRPVQPASVSPGSLPALQIAIENLQMEGKQVGRLELVGHPDGNDWRLRRLNIVNPDGSLVGDGVWRGGQAGAQTQVNLLLQISDAGKILARSGYPGTVKSGSGKLAANLSWAGNPGEFNYATLGGSLKLDTSKGQFLKMDPGIGKLLGILSLQALPKRITLDFTDVFSDGFQFDNINGNATIRHGVMDTQDFHIDGSSAKVTMKGSVDLNSETQNLHVRILPTLGDSVSLLGAFAAGPVVGIGSLIVNKVLGNPLDKLVSFEYNVSGTWSDPKVIKVGEAPVKTNNQSK
ncbi:MAG TPA: AsmA-like C-terminal region-containing protein [Gallionella sp.]|nr:AsmA-like C-terminal region-containing protein [Gallionella sp.]